jgi:DNA-binding CsgD family transcriptional regulator
MIKGGLTSKEISRLLKVSLNTVEKHRENIRRKNRNIYKKN